MMLQSTKQTTATYALPNILKSNGNYTTKFDQLIEYNME